MDIYQRDFTQSVASRIRVIDLFKAGEREEAYEIYHNDKLGDDRITYQEFEVIMGWKIAHPGWGSVLFVYPEWGDGDSDHQARYKVYLPDDYVWTNNLETVKRLLAAIGEDDYAAALEKTMKQLLRSE